MLGAARSKFRNSFTHREGSVEAYIIQGRVIDVNLVNYTVDVRSQFDQYYFRDVQVASPYLHFNNGEGLSVTPEIGAVCVVCVPSDSSPPFVLAFLMPHETVDTSSDTAPQGTASHGAPQANATAANFGGGRPQAKPGDISIRTRDNNFVTLHRGGVLQLGATEAAQRIYIPLGNLIMDVSENYSHYNSAGAISWGLQDGPAQKDKFPAQFMQTFRVYANDKAADIRVTAGKVYTPIGEPAGDAGEQNKISEFSLGTDDDNAPIIYEVAVAKTGFTVENGQTVSTSVPNQTVLRFFFDRAGGTFLRCGGNVVMSAQKKLHLHVKDDFTIQADKNFSITCDHGLEITGTDYAHLKGNLVRLGPGTTPVARQGEIVTVTLPPGIIPVLGTVTTGAGAGGTVTGFVMGGVAYGMITSGNARVLV